MNQAKNITTGKVHLIKGNDVTYCGFKSIEEKANIHVTECEEIRHDNVCEKCYVGYCKEVDSLRQ